MSDKDKEKKAKQFDNNKQINDISRRVQNTVKINLNEWLAQGIAELELKKIILSQNVNAGIKLKAIELCCKLAGFVEPEKQTIINEDNLLSNIQMEELKALWKNEMVTGNEKTVEDNVEFLLKSKAEDFDAMIEEHNKLIE